VREWLERSAPEFPVRASSEPEFPVRASRGRAWSEQEPGWSETPVRREPE